LYREYVLWIENTGCLSLDLVLPVEMKASIGAALRAVDNFLESFLLRTCFAALQWDEKGAKAK